MNRGPDMFLIGLGVVMVGGLGTLGYFGYQSYSEFSDLSSQYDEQAKELRRLESLPLYPEQSNLAKLKLQRETASEDVQTLHKQLLPMTLLLEEISPAQFQDKLRAVVSGVVDKARSAGVKLPEKFYLGFSEYQNMPPKTEAASALDRQLRAVQLAVETLLENKVDSIEGIIRTPLPEEAEVKTPAPAPAAKPLGTKKTAEKPVLFTKYPFEIDFTSDQARFRRTIDALVANDKQFFVVRPLTIDNSVDRAILKVDPNSPASGNSGGAPAAGAAGGKHAGQPSLHYLVGTERLKVALRLEMVVFANTLPK